MTEPAPARPASAEPASQAGQPRSSRRAGRRKARRWRILAAGAVVVAAGAAAFELMPASARGPVHVIVTPQALGSYTQAPALAASMKAAQLRNSIMSQGSGEASHVVAAVYEDSASPAASSAPQIILFIGGNLARSSPSSFISSFIGRLPGAVTTGAGSLGGAAACVPSVSANPAECAWADGDTFGLVASPTLGAQALAAEMRQMRLKVEHLAK
ncbi:MAG TPA: hypothetical protein VIJ82_29095 [Streptosporangiaceae bacterium]